MILLKLLIVCLNLSLIWFVPTGATEFKPSEENINGLSNSDVDRTRPSSPTRSENAKKLSKPRQITSIEAYLSSAGRSNQAAGSVGQSGSQATSDQSQGRTLAYGQTNYNYNSQPNYNQQSAPNSYLPQPSSPINYATNNYQQQAPSYPASPSYGGSNVDNYYTSSYINAGANGPIIPQPRIEGYGVLQNKLYKNNNHNYYQVGVPGQYNRYTYQQAINYDKDYTNYQPHYNQPGYKKKPAEKLGKYNSYENGYYGDDKKVKKKKKKVKLEKEVKIEIKPEKKLEVTAEISGGINENFKEPKVELKDPIKLDVDPKESVKADKKVKVELKTPFKNIEGEAGLGVDLNDPLSAIKGEKKLKVELKNPFQKDEVKEEIKVPIKEGEKIKDDLVNEGEKLKDPIKVVEIKKEGKVELDLGSGTKKPTLVDPIKETLKVKEPEGLVLEDPIGSDSEETIDDDELKPDVKLSGNAGGELKLADPIKVELKEDPKKVQDPQVVLKNPLREPLAEKESKIEFALPEKTEVKEPKKDDGLKFELPNPFNFDPLKFALNGDSKSKSDSDKPFSLDFGGGSDPKLGLGDPVLAAKRDDKDEGEREKVFMADDLFAERPDDGPSVKVGGGANIGTTVGVKTPEKESEVVVLKNGQIQDKTV